MKINTQTAELWKDAIFVIEIHHQYVGSVWMADGKDDFVSANQATYASDGEAPESDDFGDWVEYAAHDLRALKMMDLSEAVEYIEAGKEGSNKLYALLVDYDFIS